MLLLNPSIKAMMSPQSSTGQTVTPFTPTGAAKTTVINRSTHSEGATPNAHPCTTRLCGARQAGWASPTGNQHTHSNIATDLCLSMFAWQPPAMRASPPGTGTTRPTTRSTARVPTHRFPPTLASTEAPGACPGTGRASPNMKPLATGQVNQDPMSKGG